MTEYILKRGEPPKWVGKWYFGAMLSYGGMPNKRRYSIEAHTFEGEMAEPKTLELVYPLSERKIDPMKRKLNVLNVTPEEVILQYVK